MMAAINAYKHTFAALYIWRNRTKTLMVYIAGDE